MNLFKRTFLVFFVAFFSFFLFFNIAEAKKNEIWPVRPKPTVLLPAVLYYQEHQLTCEIASLRIALSAQGIFVSEAEIIENMEIDNTPKEGNIWGNPHRGFLGDIDGRMMSTGYGVYWNPIAKTGSLWKETKIIENGKISTLIKHLNEGRPIILWGYIGAKRATSWFTPEGDLIKGYRGEHARVLVGYSGTASNPTGFFILDPMYGKVFWDRQQFITQWNSFKRVGVIIYAENSFSNVKNFFSSLAILGSGSLKKFQKSLQAFAGVKYFYVDD